MRNDDILPNLKQERDYRAFCDGAESFIKRWAPQGRREQTEFTADLMGLFRGMIITQQMIHQEVAAHYFKQSMDATAMQRRSMVLGMDHRAAGPDMTTYSIRNADGSMRPATQQEVAEMNHRDAWDNLKEGPKDEG